MTYDVLFCSIIRFQACSISTTTAVDKLIDMFPPVSISYGAYPITTFHSISYSYQYHYYYYYCPQQKPASQNVENSVQRLSKASSNLAAECQNSAHTDQAQQTRLIMNGAYDVAKAARHLVTCVETAQ